MKLIETLGEAIERNAANLPDEVFVTCDGENRTFREVAERILRLGSALHRGGARKQDRVAILAMNCPEYIDAYGLSELIGYVLVLVNFRLAPPEVSWILNDSQPSVLIFEHRYAELVERIKGTCPTIRQFICIGGDTPDWAVDYETLLASGAQEGPPFRSLKDDYVSIIYTSGTTGRPKGVLCKHKQMLSLGLTQAIEYGSAIGTTALVMMPLFHQGAKTIYTAQMLRGGRVLIHRTFDPQMALAAIEHERVQISALVPTMLQAMLEVPGADRYDVSSVRSIISFGAAMPVPLLRQAIATFGPVFFNGYGQTEGGNTILRPQYLLLEGTQEQLRRVGSVGQPMMHTEMKIVDDDGHEVPDGTHGEICLRSDQVMEGYWNNHAATLEAIREGWLFTGDIGYIGQDNFLYVVDRKKDMIITGGENVYSPEVESAVMTHPAVQEVAVIGIPDERWGEAVCAVIVLRPEATCTGPEIIAHAREQVAAYKCPKRIEFAPDLPHVPTGKVDKVALRKAYC